MFKVKKTWYPEIGETKCAIMNESQEMDEEGNTSIISFSRLGGFYANLCSAQMLRSMGPSNKY